MVDMSLATASALEPYLVLFAEFVDDSIDAPAFVERFLRPYLADSTRWDTQIFPVLDRVFVDADAYVESDELRPQVVDAIGGEELRRSVAAALAELRGR